MKTLELLAETDDAFAAESLLPVLVDNTTAAVFFKDRAGRYLMVNPTCERLWGVSRDALLGRTDQEVLPGESARRVMANDRRVMESKMSAEFEERIEFPTGARTYLSSKSPLLDSSGACRGICGVATEITARERAYRELERSERQLAELHRRKDAFLAVLAHELRNPLAPILTAAELLSDAGKSREAEVILRQVRHLSRLIEDLMDAARLTRGRVQLQRQPVALASVLERAREMVAARLERGGHQLKLRLPAAPLRVNGDPERLTQVFGNLLDNAVQYSAPSGAICVEVEREGELAVVRVADEGRGIEPERLRDLFRGFDRGGELPHHAPSSGLGLGLMIVHHLVELHGGSVEAHSEGPGRGSEFSVRLPLADAGEVAGESARGTPVEARPRRVLVVDDNRDAADLLAQLVEAAGHEAEICYRGGEVFERVRRGQPDVVILDIGLPDMDGWEVAERLRAEHGADLQLVALTGYGQTHDRQRSERAGFDLHLVKPASFDQIRPLLAGPASSDSQG